MQISLDPVHHIEAAGEDEANGRRLWRSVGDDPGFHIRLPVIRPRWLFIRLHDADQILSPQIYFDFGTGFSERRSIAVPEARDLCLVLDIGRFGAIRALRLDPTICPATFSCDIQALASVSEARESLNAWKNAYPDGHTEWIDEVGVLWAVRNFIAGPKRGRTVAEHLADVYAIADQRTAGFTEPHPDRLWLSIVVPTYNTPVRYLDDLLRSVEKQQAGGIELIFSDDASTSSATLDWLEKNRSKDFVQIVLNERNAGIAEATNAGLAAAGGEWVTFLDHDDVVAPSALKIIRRTLLDRPQTQFLFTDEVVVNRRLKPRGLMAKPAYDPVLLTGMNYINHFSFYRRARLNAIGRLRSGFQGSQDYDTVLRYTCGLRDDEILHLPYPAYWWRRDGSTFSVKHLDQATASARKAIGDHFLRQQKEVALVGAITPALHRVSFVATSPRVSVVIPSRNAFGLIDAVVEDLLTRTDYPDLELIIVDNGSDDPRVLQFYDRLVAERRNVVIDRYESAFNFARSVNRGFARATGEHVLLLNNDISVIHPDWLAEMVSCLNFDRAGIVGAKLLYPDATLQHAGVVTGFGGLAGHWYLGKKADHGGQMNRLHVRSSMTSVTAAAMLISGECRQAVGDMDEQNFAIAYNDVDYCLRAYKKGFRTVWTPFASLFHHESATRGTDTTLKNRVRFEREKKNLRRIHATESFLDPATSPHYGRDRSVPVLTRLSALPAPRHWYLDMNAPDALASGPTVENRRHSPTE